MYLASTGCKLRVDFGRPYSPNSDSNHDSTHVAPSMKLLSGEPWSNTLPCPCAGAGSDVDKVVEYRAFARMRRAFPEAYTSYEMGNFSRFMIKACDGPL